VTTRVRFESRPLSWLPVAGALLAVWLLCEWAGRTADVGDADDRLVLIPLAMLSLAALDLIQFRDGGITPGGGAVVVLSSFLPNSDGSSSGTASRASAYPRSCASTGSRGRCSGGGSGSRARNSTRR
jgi:hypothetical protein